VNVEGGEKKFESLSYRWQLAAAAAAEDVAFLR
jgi:hypothetical protein